MQNLLKHLDHLRIKGYFYLFNGLIAPNHDALRDLPVPIRAYLMITNYRSHQVKRSPQVVQIGATAVCLF